MADSETEAGHNEYQLVGGTVLLQGADIATLKKAATVLGIVMFVIYNLTLEICVLRDHHITRLGSKKKRNSAPPVDTSAKPVPQTPSSMEDKAPSGIGNLFGWVRSSSTKPAKKNGVRKLIDRISGGKSKTVDVKTPTTTNKRASIRSVLSPEPTRFSETSRLTKEKLQLSDLFNSRQMRNSQSLLNELGISDSAMHYFSNLLRSMNQAVLSSTPGVIYPPPRLILRLHEDEEVINAIGVDAWICLRPNNATVIQTLSGFRAMELHRFVGTPARQRLSRKSTSRTGDTWSTTSNATTTSSVPQSITAYSTLRNPKMALDANLELNYLNLKTDSVQSLIDHQSIAVSFSSFSTGDTMVRCEGPSIYVIDFYRFSSHYHPTGDKPLGEVIMNWCNEARQSSLISKESLASVKTGSSDRNSVNTSDRSTKANGSTRRRDARDPRQCAGGCPVCRRSIQDHIFTFCHGTSRISVTIGADRTRNKTVNRASKDDMAMDDNDMGVVMWTACKVCKEQLKPQPMSLPTYKYSFGKYLELLLYDKEFMPPKEMCEHSSDRPSVLRCFQHKGIIIQFDYEDIELFEMRVPRLQVVLPENNLQDDSDKFDHESTTEPNATFRNVAIELAACEEALQQAEGEVDAFFSAVDRHIKLLQEYLVAEDKLERQSNTFFLGQTKAQALRSELEQLHQLFKSEKDNLLRELDKMVGDEMNDFNRWFSIKVKSIMDSLSLWQETNCPELDAECVWDPMPDWIRLDTVHLFPTSSVPVREDEPSSIIAHTLSSKDYQEELEQKPILSESLQSSTSSSAAALFTESPQSKTPDERATVEFSSAEPSEFGGSTQPKDVPINRELIHGFYSTVGRETVSISNTLASVTAPASLRTTLLETIRDMNVTERIGSRLSTFGLVENIKSDRELELLGNKLTMANQNNTSLPIGMDDRMLKSIENDVAMGVKDVSRKVLDVTTYVSGASAGKKPKRSDSLITEVKVTSVINESSNRPSPSGQPGSMKSSDSENDHKPPNTMSPHIKHSE